MAGVYCNLIKELIIQTKINGKLLNDINNLFSEIDKKNPRVDVMPIYEDHNKMVREEYVKIKADPVYKYFDGTNLLNSFLSTIVIPFEFLKGKEIKNYNLKNVNREAYNYCQYIIDRIYNSERLIIYNYGNQRPQLDLYNFIRNLRDAIAHSGNGQVFFSSCDGINIDQIYFYNEKRSKDRNGNMGEIINLFFVKIDLKEELFPFLNAFNDIVLDIESTDANYTFEDANSFCESKTGRVLD